MALATSNAAEWIQKEAVAQAMASTLSAPEMHPRYEINRLLFFRRKNISRLYKKKPIVTLVSAARLVLAILELPPAPDLVRYTCSRDTPKIRRRAAKKAWESLSSLPINNHLDFKISGTG